MKKTVSVLLIISMLLFAFCACDKPGNGGTEVTLPEAGDGKESILKLAYDKSEELDPFTAESVVNTQLMALVYDGLYKLDKNYKPVTVAAKSSIVTAESVNVTLDAVKFSDGSSVTASDVSYSFSLAKASPAYGTRLANFGDVKITAPNMLMFSLETPDPYALSCLDFPIVKNGSVGAMPVGCGRYMFSKNGEAVYMIVNPNKSGFRPTIKTVILEPLRDTESIESSLEIGNTGFYYDDLSDGSFSRINAHTVEMGINNFVFLGINSESTVFSNADIRKALNLAVDRNAVVSNAFQGHAREAYSPFNPDWYELITKDLVISKNDAQAAELIKNSEIDIAENEISLLVNKENPFKLEAAQLIVSSLTALGFEVRLKDYTAEYYSEALKEGLYDLYIGEYRLTPNMNLSPMFSGAVGYGVDPSCACAKRYNRLLNGECELMDFINTFNEELPFIPLCYRNAAASYTNSMDADFACCDGDVYYDIEMWRYK